LCHTHKHTAPPPSRRRFCELLVSAATPAVDVLCSGGGGGGRDVGFARAVKEKIYVGAGLAGGCGWR